MIKNEKLPGWVTKEKTTGRTKDPHTQGPGYNKRFTTQGKGGKKENARRRPKNPTYMDSSTSGKKIIFGAKKK